MDFSSFFISNFISNLHPLKQKFQWIWHAINIHCCSECGCIFYSYKWYCIIGLSFFFFTPHYFEIIHVAVFISSPWFLLSLCIPLHFTLHCLSHIHSGCLIQRPGKNLSALDRGWRCRGNRTPLCLILLSAVALQRLRVNKCVFSLESVVLSRFLILASLMGRKCYLAVLAFSDDQT